MVKNLLAMPKNPGSISGSENPLENGMATHSNILAWRIPWTEESGGLQSIGSQRVRRGHSIFKIFHFSLWWHHVTASF